MFGFNLACSYPFPPPAAEAYCTLAGRLGELDEAVYVYPLWETHVTIATFVNFSRHRRPSGPQLQELRSLMKPVLELLAILFDGENFAPFQLKFGAPVLTPKAAILPAENPTGEIARMRRRTRELLTARPALLKSLERAGFNIPGIIHSTIMRFRGTPRDLSGFAAIAAASPPLVMTVHEILLTTETKPYMREGEIIHRFLCREQR